MRNRKNVSKLLALSCLMMVSMLVATAVPVFAHDFEYKDVDPDTGNIVIVTGHCKTYADMMKMHTDVIPAAQARVAAAMEVHILDILDY